MARTVAPRGVDLVAAMQRRFERRGIRTHLIETHISWVLLAGRHAYKFKKPLRLPFLDASSLPLRRRLCDEEVRLNRRLAPSLYIDVVPLRAGSHGPSFHGRGEVLEWVVKMHRMPAGALASDRLTRGRLTSEELALLAGHLARFHEGAQGVPPQEIHDPATQLLGEVDRVVANLAQWWPDARATCLALRTWFEQRCHGDLGQRFAQRLAAGRVRDGHGDLHLDNVVVLPEGVTAFDCIEFDPALRRIDVMCDIGFLVMDLQAHGRRDLAFAFLDAYLQASGDYDGLSVLRDYMVYRALVRAMVVTVRQRQHASSTSLPAPAYLALAVRLTQPTLGRLLITHGLPGSGKTHLSQQLLERAGAVRVRSDVERKRLAAGPAGSTMAADLYGADATRATYERVLQAAETSLRHGYPTIVDAAFLRGWQREAARQVAQAHRAPFTVLSCQAPLEVLRQRLTHRQAEAADASDADARVLERCRADQESLRDDERGSAIVVDTARPLPLASVLAHWLAATA